MNETKIKFAGEPTEPKAAKAYTGDMTTWPDGIYWSEPDCYVIVCGKRIVRLARGKILIGYGETNRTLAAWYVMSRDVEIDTIVFKGPMDFPEGEPTEWRNL